MTSRFLCPYSTFFNTSNALLKTRLRLRIKSYVHLCGDCIEVVGKIVMFYDVSKWSCIDGENNGTKYWPLRYSKGCYCWRRCLLFMWIDDDRFPRYDFIQSSAVPLIPNRFCGSLNRWSWSIVSNTAKRSSNTSVTPFLVSSWRRTSFCTLK